jgi:hypothetical protein
MPRARSPISTSSSANDLEDSQDLVVHLPAAVRSDGGM